ncbi:hypothetical protein DPMN_086902 [Dreissena polymorpha]|uniref:Uncharacterized protein n=1 Tax=Dreissena polymorpha TaxID=45954 RepID=A0A9D4KR94_DREPO|nr:hypothetical protein DPMN_086902 [Dreissena polymorpha]
MIGQKLKTVPPTGAHVFQGIRSTLELNQDIIKTNILTNFETRPRFHWDKMECLRANVNGLTDGRTYDGQRQVTKAHLSNQSWCTIYVSDGLVRGATIDFTRSDDRFPVGGTKFSPEVPD